MGKRVLFEGNRVKFSDALRRDHPFSPKEEIDYRLLEEAEERGEA